MKIALVLVLISFFSFNIFAQDAISKSNYLRLSIFDAAGRPVTGLKSENFILSDGKTPLKVAQLTAEDDEPTAISIVIDEGNFPGVAAMLALRFIQKANSSNDYCIIGTDQNAQLLADWKSADDRLIASLNKIAGTKAKSKNSAVFDAVAFGLEKLRQSTLKKKVLLFFGSSGDLKSKTSFAKLKDSAENSDAIIYAVNFYMMPDYSSVSVSDEKLEKLTDVGGGRTFDFYLDSGTQMSLNSAGIGSDPLRREIVQKPSAMVRNPERDASDFSEMLAAYVQKTYLLAYESNAANGDGKIEVKVNFQDDQGKKVKLKTRLKKLSQQ
jgi:hypothetical protein